MANPKKKSHIKKGDLVEVISGNEKGKRGKVLSIDTQRGRAIVEGLNLRIFHKKPTQGSPGKREKKPSSINNSNLMLVNPYDGTRTRIGRKLNEAGKLQRYAKKTQNFI
ncbi:MAG: 50S ribosomal protein L24 [Cytophagales bacterium]